MKLSPSVAMAVNYDIGNEINYNHPKTVHSVATLDSPHYYKFPSFATTGTSHYKKDEVKNIGRSILTLLTFLFFLHIILSCIQEQSGNNINPQVVIMQAKHEDQTKAALWQKAEEPIFQKEEQDGYDHRSDIIRN